MFALKVVAGMGLLLGQPVMVHFGMPSSIPTHWQNLSILFICGCNHSNLFVRITRLSAYADEAST
jgi:hypothetical protein